MINNDIREALQKTCAALNKYNVEYMLIGGVAVGFYGYQRISGGPSYGSREIKHDIDFWYNPTTENFNNIIRALEEMKIDTQSLKTIIFDPHKTYLRIPHTTFKTEFLPQMSGLTSFKDSKNNNTKIHLDGNDISIIGYADLIANKQAVNRSFDKADIEELEKHRKKG